MYWEIEIKLGQLIMMIPPSFRQLPRFLGRLSNSTLSVAKNSKNFVNFVTDLYQTPSKWNGLSTQKLLDLHAERQARLGDLYKPSSEEFDALLPSARELGLTNSEFKKIYYSPREKIEKECWIEDFSNDDSSLKPYEFDELPSQAHLLVQQHREQRYYNRLAAYELPLLVQHRQEYKRPSISSHFITYRYTTYIGEEHPASRKVVLSFKTSNLDLNSRELHKLRLLAKTRYDPNTDIFKMSSELFEESAQNARYLSDVLERLIKEAKDMTDDFSDIPLDNRHVIARNLRKKPRKYKFPEEWKRPEDAPKKTINLFEISN